MDIGSLPVSNTRSSPLKNHAQEVVPVMPVSASKSQALEAYFWPPKNNTFSRMHSEGSRFTWGLGVRLCSPSLAFAFATVGNRSQPSATVFVRAVRLSTLASASGVVRKACPVDSLSSQLFWCLQRRCLCERSVSPQLYWCLQRRCLCERSVSPQLYWCLQRRCLCE